MELNWNWAEMWFSFLWTPGGGDANHRKQARQLRARGCGRRRHRFETALRRTLMIQISIMLCLYLWLLRPLIARLNVQRQRKLRVTHWREKKKNLTLQKKKKKETSKNPQTLQKLLHGSVTNLQSRAKDWTDSAAVCSRYKHPCQRHWGVSSREREERR